MAEGRADGPVWEEYASVASHPLRQVFMPGLVWRIAQDFGHRPLRILEVGSWCGLSALTWAHALGEHNGAQGEITCVDPWAPYLDTEINPSDDYALLDETARSGDPYGTFLHNIGFAPDGVKIVHHRARSDAALPALEAESFDIVYLDGDHSYRAALADIELSRRLVRDGGMLCGDDLEFQAHELGDRLPDDPDGPEYIVDALTESAYHPGVTRAVAEAFGPVSAWVGFWAMRRRGKAWEPVSLDGMPFYVPPHLPPEYVMYIKSAILDGLGEG